MTTPGNAMDARPGLREWVLGELDRRLGLSREAAAEEFAAGPWEVDPEPSGGMLSIRSTTAPYGTGYVADADARRPALAAHIAASDPSRLGALYGWMRARVEEHEWTPVKAPSFGFTHQCHACNLWMKERDEACCPFVRSLADALGYREDGGGNSEQCPTCESPDPARHPAMQWEGEVQPCSDPFHAKAIIR